MGYDSASNAGLGDSWDSSPFSENNGTPMRNSVTNRAPILRASLVLVAMCIVASVQLPVASVPAQPPEKVIARAHTHAPIFVRLSPPVCLRSPYPLSVAGLPASSSSALCVCVYVCVCMCVTALLSYAASEELQRTRG